MSTRKADNVPRQTPPSSIEETINCDDLLIAILIRVPTKSLIRFKCVSKHWLKLITTPSFGHNHTYRISYIHISGFYFYTVPHYTLYPVPLKPYHTLPPLSFISTVNNHGFRVLDSCNGLFLCSHGYQNPLSVSNPTAQKYTAIPLPPLLKYRFVLHTCLAFNPKISPHYRVVFIEHEYIGLYEIDIYFSETKSWKHVRIEGESFETPYHMVFWDGQVHWLSRKGIHFQFDIDKETIVECLLPHRACDGVRFDYLRECDGDLVMVGYSKDYRKGYWIYEMRRGTRAWRLKLRVHIGAIHQSFVLEKNELHLLSVLKRTHESNMVLVLADMIKVFSYDTKLNAIEEIYDFSSPNPHRKDYPCGFAH